MNMYIYIHIYISKCKHVYVYEYIYIYCVGAMIHSNIYRLVVYINLYFKKLYLLKENMSDDGLTEVADSDGEEAFQSHVNIH